jgi:hypothetical protein
MISKKAPTQIPDGYVLAGVNMLLPFGAVILQLLSDQQEHSKQEVIERLIHTFDLADEYLEQRTASGKSRVFSNDVDETRAVLKKLGLIEATRRLHFQITPQGLEVLAKKTTREDGPFIRSLVLCVRAFERSGPDIYISPLYTRD